MKFALGPNADAKDVGFEWCLLMVLVPFLSPDVGTPRPFSCTLCLCLAQLEGTFRQFSLLHMPSSVLMFSLCPFHEYRQPGASFCVWCVVQSVLRTPGHSHFASRLSMAPGAPVVTVLTVPSLMSLLSVAHLVALSFGKWEVAFFFFFFKCQLVLTHRFD